MNNKNHKWLSNLIDNISTRYEQQCKDMKQLYFCQVTARKDYIKSLFDNGCMFYRWHSNEVENYINKLKKCNNNLKVSIKKKGCGYGVYVDRDDGDI